MFKTIIQFFKDISRFFQFMIEVRKNKPDPDKIDILIFDSLKEADRRLNRIRHIDGTTTYNKLGSDQ